MQLADRIRQAISWLGSRRTTFIAPSIFWNTAKILVVVALTLDPCLQVGTRRRS